MVNKNNERRKDKMRRFFNRPKAAKIKNWRIHREGKFTGPEVLIGGNISGLLPSDKYSARHFSATITEAYNKGRSVLVRDESGRSYKLTRNNVCDLYARIHVAYERLQAACTA
jgi:hypothetical protein